MTIRIGYACINTVLQSPNRTCRLANASPDRIIELGRSNLLSLVEILRFNIAQGIPLFRISSDTIPFGSHPINQLPWWDILAPQFAAAGELVRGHGLRVSMHPGQYTVLNSPRPEVAQASVAELEYHTRFLDALGVDTSHKIVLHLGGVYGDKAASRQRLIDQIQTLPAGVRARLVLENDEKSYSLADALEVSGATGVPVVFDVFHHRWNPAFRDEPLLRLVERAAQTWGSADGRPKLHYSDPWPGKPPGSHSQQVDLDAFSRFLGEIAGLEVDVMLEVKDKEQSVLAVYGRFPALRASLESAGKN